MSLYAPPPEAASRPAFGHAMRSHWALDPDITYLNHGTVGATPRRVLAAQQAIRDRMERQPSRFLLREVAPMLRPNPRGGGHAPALLREAAAAVAGFVHARGDDVVFVDNATTGCNAVLRSLPLSAGDEILITDHAYGAIANVARFVARERGAAIRTVALPYPRPTTEGIVDAVLAGVGPRTRIAVIDHITSESAIVMPLAEIAAACRSRGVPVLGDGAHAPGILDLDVPALAVDWYAANLHKWAYAPRSSGFLWASPERQSDLHPPVISWGLDHGFAAEFDWVGTRDPSPHLAAPEGIAMLRDLGFAAVRAYNHDLAWQAAHLLTERLGTFIPVAASQVGCMVTVPLPDSLGSTQEDALRLRDALLFEDRIEAQLHAFRGRFWVRISAQVYNEIADVERLLAGIARRA